MSHLNLDKLLSLSSIAVVGASERSDAIGSRVINNLRAMGFSGPIYPVNPRYTEVCGLPCHASLSALPERVDAAFLGVPARNGPDLLAPRCDIDAAARAIAAFSRIAAAHSEFYAAMEINPLIVSQHGAVGVDLLIEPHASSSETT